MEDPLIQTRRFNRDTGDGSFLWYKFLLSGTPGTGAGSENAMADQEDLRELVAGLAARQSETERTLHQVIRQVIRLSEELETPWDENRLEIPLEPEEPLEFPWFRSLKELIQQYFGASMASEGVQRLDLGVGLDGYGYSSSAVFAAEIEWDLGDEGVDRMLQILRDFRKLFGAHEGKKLYGILATNEISEDIQKRVLNEGIYLVAMHGDLYELRVPEGFQPRAF